MKKLKTANVSPSPSRMIQGVYLNSPLCNATNGDLGTSYSRQYAKK